MTSFSISTGRPRKRVLVVCPWFFEGDAVGAAARDTFLAIQSYERYDCTAIWQHNDYAEVTGHAVPDLHALRAHPAFQQADVIIYVFAVYHEFHDAMIDGNGHGRQVVRFHNVTPAVFMPNHLKPVIDRSFLQMQNFANADEIWADSQENADELLRQGLGDQSTVIVPLVVNPVVVGQAQGKRRDVIRMLYVGRFFLSKGVHEIVEAVAELRARVDVPLRLVLAGNLRFSDPDYVERVRKLITDLDMDDIVSFRGSVHRDELAELYDEAHIYLTGSRHEGFCVPVIEGLIAGCVPVSYAVSNLRYIANGLGRLADDDTPHGLCEALVPIVCGLRGPARKVALPLNRGSTRLDEFDEAAGRYVKAFTMARFAEVHARRLRELAG